MNQKELASFICMGCMALAVILITIARRLNPGAVSRVLTMIAWGLLVPTLILMIYVVF